jgi:hypothetical protein
MKRFIDRTFHKFMMSKPVVDVLVKLLVEVHDHLEKAKEYSAKAQMYRECTKTCRGCCSEKTTQSDFTKSPTNSSWTS